MFRQTNGTAIGLDSADLAIEFDPAVFQVTGVRLGDVPRGFTLTESYDNATGEIIASLRSTSGPIALTPGTEGSLLLIDLTIRPGASLGAARINLLGEGRVGSTVLYTSLNDGNLTLVPGSDRLRPRPDRRRRQRRRADHVADQFRRILPNNGRVFDSYRQVGPCRHRDRYRDSKRGSNLIISRVGDQLRSKGGCGRATWSRRSRAIEALHGTRPGVQLPTTLAFLDKIETGDSTGTENIPWTPSEQPGIILTGNDLLNAPVQKKARDSRVLVTPVTPVVAGSGWR